MNFTNTCFVSQTFWLKNLVNECLDWDHEHDLDKKGGSRGLTPQKRYSGVQILWRFFWCVGTKNADGKASGKYDWPNLLGSDKTILLADLLSKLHNTLLPQTVSMLLRYGQYLLRHLQSCRQLESWKTPKIHFFFHESKAVDFFVPQIK